MTIATALEAEARQLFEEESKRLARAAARQRGDMERGHTSHDGFACVRWLVGELIELVHQDPNRPVRDIEPIIRQRVFEQQFVDECGDATMDARSCDELEHHIHVLVRVLERMRQRALRRGRGATMAATPVMFG